VSQISAVNLGEITYDERRIAFRALGVDARPWHSGQDPRFDMNVRLDLIGSTTRGCIHNLPAHLVLRWTDREAETPIALAAD